MIKISEFLKFLQPTNNRDVLETEYSDLQKEITRFNIPTFELAIKSLGRHTFTNDLAANMLVLLEQVSGIKGKAHQNFLHVFLDLSNKINSQLPFIESLIERHFEEDLSIHSLDLARINILRYLPIMTSYALALEVNLKSEDESLELIPADRDWLANNRRAFLDSCKIIHKHSGNIEKIFDNLPEVNIDPTNIKTVESTLPPQQTDPLGMGFVPLCVNPFYMVRKIISNYQVERYHLAEEEVASLKLKVYNLKILNEGRNDPKTQHQINYIEEQRIRPLNEKIQKWEKEYGVTT